MAYDIVNSTHFYVTTAVVKYVHGINLVQQCFPTFFPARPLFHTNTFTAHVYTSALRVFPGPTSGTYAQLLLFTVAQHCQHLLPWRIIECSLTVTWITNRSHLVASRAFSGRSTNSGSTSPELRTWTAVC